MSSVSKNRTFCEYVPEMLLNKTLPDVAISIIMYVHIPVDVCSYTCRCMIVYLLMYVCIRIDVHLYTCRCRQGNPGVNTWFYPGDLILYMPVLRLHLPVLRLHMPMLRLHMTMLRLHMLMLRLHMPMLNPVYMPIGSEEDNKRLSENRVDCVLLGMKNNPVASKGINSKSHLLRSFSRTRYCAVQLQ